ncbi:hypothetical protein F5X99DRAFT_405186 [Biscogniauxia marginata]|nr:hypothetical protein F5X99DRAFT_405186 [Biscogniauxia marginata]
MIAFHSSVVPAGGLLQYHGPVHRGGITYPRGPTNRRWSTHHGRSTDYSDPRNHKTHHSQPTQRGSKWEIVNSAPQKDAGAQEVRTWLLKVLRRRCHPDPESVLMQMDWSGREVHRATYLGMWHRFRSEPDGRLIAHDIHDAIKQSRRKIRSQRRKESRASLPEDMMALIEADKD